ncbi:MAG: galactokinase [bacterium]
MSQICRRFSEAYGGSNCDFVVRAPGRVNLIGEHTDYNGFPVFPISLDRAVYAAVRLREDKTISIRNTDTTFPAHTFQVEQHIPPDSVGDWGNYVKAGIQGVIDWSENLKAADELRGFDALIEGDIPPGVGLSSSSAMVVASALAFLRANNLTYDRIRLAEMLAFAEHYVGTQGGGMDQAICLLGEMDKALKIDFFPLTVSAVPIPEGWTVVICNSLIQAEKTKAAMRLYNRRPIECRIAVAMLEKKIRKSQGSVSRLADFCGEEMNIPSLLEMTQSLFHEGGYSWREIAEFLGESPDEVASRFGKMRDGSLFGEVVDGFQLRKRVRHVLTEAIRVEESAKCLASGDTQRFGALMNESHRSCRDDYEISCPELDVLVQFARAAGAVGSRLTGAGFGGCAVSLLRDDSVEPFSIRVWDEYYQRYLRLKRPDLVDRVDEEDVLFVSRPAQGAQILK